jgi:hypothetical protein
MRAGCPCAPFSLNKMLEWFIRAIRHEKEIKWIQIEKEEVKLSLFVEELILHLKNSKDCTKRLLNLMSAFSKVAG